MIASTLVIVFGATRGWTRHGVGELHQAQWSLTNLKSHTVLATGSVDRNYFEVI